MSVHFKNPKQINSSINSDKLYELIMNTSYIDFFIKMQLQVVNVFVSLQATIILRKLQKIHKKGSTDPLPHRTKGKQSN